MRYEDDQCEQCGGVRVARSTLCEDCLVRSVNKLRPALIIAEARIKELEFKLDRSMKLADRLLSHISSEAVYISELRLELWEAKEIIRRGWKHA